MSVRTVAAAGTSFLVREEGSGDGTPVLLLHGVPETSTCWRHLLPRLADGRRVLAPDLPGLGGSSYSGPYDVPSLVEQLAALVEAEVGGPVDVVGHDWGGSLALGLAGARPDLVRRLAVANAPYRSVPLHRALHIPFFALPAVPEALFRVGGRRVVGAMLDLGWRSTPPLDAEARAEYEAAYSRPATVRAMLGYYRAAARPRLAAAVRRSSAPGGAPRVQAEHMLVLWGALDPVLPIATGEAVVRDLGPECVMVTVPGVGHFVVEEAPDVVGDVLVDFLSDSRTPSTEAAAPPEGPDVHRVPETAPPSGDLGDAPSVGPVPVGGTPAEQAAAQASPAQKAPPKAAPAKKAAPEAVRATKAASKKAPAKKGSATPPSRKAGDSGPSPEVPPSPGTA